MPAAALPVTVLPGFWGPGKPTLLNYPLHNHEGMRAAPDGWANPFPAWDEAPDR